MKVDARWTLKSRLILYRGPGLVAPLRPAAHWSLTLRGRLTPPRFSDCSSNNLKNAQDGCQVPIFTQSNTDNTTGVMFHYFHRFLQNQEHGLRLKLIISFRLYTWNLEGVKGSASAQGYVEYDHHKTKGFVSSEHAQLEHADVNTRYAQESRPSTCDRNFAMVQGLHPGTVVRTDSTSTEAAPPAGCGGQSSALQSIFQASKKKKHLSKRCREWNTYRPFQHPSIMITQIPCV